jgi:hypothetical protein
MLFQYGKVQVATVFLGLVLSLAYLGNQANFSERSEVHNSRGPASIGSVTMASSSHDPLQTIRENMLAEEVAVPSAQRSLASVGAPANSIESMRFGDLEGKYAFKMSGDHISEISLINSNSQRPAVIPNRADFLGKYAEHFGAASKPKHLSSVLKGDHLVETYRVKAKSGPDRIIEVTLGEANSFLALRTEEAPTLKLF